MVAAFLILSLMAPASGYQPVRVWLGTGGPFVPGARVRVYVQTDADGYLVVLHRRPDGGVDVLFPGDPETDPFARAGTYEIRGPEDAPALTVAGPLGRGTVLAALSPDPFRFAEFVRGGVWNAGALTASWAGSGAEASLTDVVQRMLGDGAFNYDLVTYAVAPEAGYAVADTAAATAPSAACVACDVQYNTVVVEQLSFAALRLHHRLAAPTPGPAPAPPALALYRGGRLNAVTSVQSSPTATPVPRRATPVVRTLPPLVIVQRPVRSRAATALPAFPAPMAPRRRAAGSPGPAVGAPPMARAMATMPARAPLLVRGAPAGAPRAGTLAVPTAAAPAAHAGALRAVGWRH